MQLVRHGTRSLKEWPEAYENPTIIQDLTFNRGSRLITGTAPTDFNFEDEVAATRR